MSSAALSVCCLFLVVCASVVVPLPYFYDNMTSKANTLISLYRLFMRAVAKLPETLQVTLRQTGLDGDLGTGAAAGDRDENRRY